MGYSVVLIDLDDTLLDFAAASHHALHSMCASYGRPITEEERVQFEAINHRCWKELEQGVITRDQLSYIRFAEFFKLVGIEADPLEANLRFRAGLSESAILIPGAPELCQELSQRVELYVVTNGFVDTQTKRIEAAGLTGYFKEIFASQKIGFTKPDPRFFDAVFASIGPEKKSQTIILGDSLSSDIQGGHDYGLKTCWFDRSHSENRPAICDYIIHDLGQFIKEILQS